MRQVDQTGLKVGQALTILLLLAAFVLGSPLLVAFVGVAQFLGALNAPYAPYRLFYTGVARRFVQPNVIPDNPEPHRFAQGFGGVVLALAVVALLAGLSTLGWGLVWLVIALAALNLFLGFCAGCFVYYQLSKLGVPGFDRRPMGQGG